ncbi:MAG: dihydrolipoyl dehydrogenase family protein [Spirochaeta sp.]
MSKRKSGFSHDIIVIGGGAAGLSTASGCAQLGMKTALIERSSMGGDCLYYGCIPSKTLLRSTAVLQAAREAERFGVAEGIQVDLDSIKMPTLNARIQGVINRIEPHDSPERFRSLGVDVYNISARFLDPHQIELEDGTRLSAPRMVLATGSKPAVPPVPGLSESGFLTNLDAFSQEKLPSRLITLGGGPIGVELSQAFARLGVQVTIVEAMPEILPREDADMAGIIRARLEREGVRVLTGSSAAEVTRTQAGVTMQLQNGTQLEADEILVATGRSADNESLDYQKAGIRTERGYFTVDDKLRTSCRHIMAVGDCNGRMQFTHTASAEASLAVRRMGLRLPGKMNWKTIPWCTYTEPELASAGYNENRAAADGLRFDTVEVDLAGNDRALAEGEPEGKLKMLFDAKKRVIGVQIIAPHAGELLLPGIMAVQHRWKLSQFLSPVFPYPTISEAYKTAAGKVYSPKLFNPRVRALLRLLFGYRGGTGAKRGSA